MIDTQKQNKEKEAEKAKERQTKAELKTAYTQGGSGEEAFFKKINDGRGHEAGDKVLVHTGKLLASLCRIPEKWAKG